MPQQHRTSLSENETGTVDLDFTSSADYSILLSTLADETMNENLAKLIDAVAQSMALDVTLISESDSYLDLGGDSLGALYVVEDLEAQGLILDVVELLEQVSLSKIALAIRRK
jgi:aryl carrier-like protein